MPGNEQRDDSGDDHHSVYPIDHLMEAKLSTARPRENSIERTALLRKLVDAPSVPFVLIAAPVGYGKSTLLAQWHSHERHSHQRNTDARCPGRGRPRPFAVVALDGGDNDP
ncbi:MAG TPA: hypothetical protein VFQ48_00200, partial [Pseudonocardiaceae bacterium]|nr:hypothetical protein [Pseudonocardiaceae bacterium]